MLLRVPCRPLPLHLHKFRVGLRTNSVPAPVPATGYFSKGIPVYSGHSATGAQNLPKFRVWMYRTYTSSGTGKIPVKLPYRKLGPVFSAWLQEIARKKKEVVPGIIYVYDVLLCHSFTTSTLLYPNFKLSWGRRLLLYHSFTTSTLLYANFKLSWGRRHPRESMFLCERWYYY